MKKNKISRYILAVCILSLFVVLVLIIQRSYINLIGQSAKIDANPGNPIIPKLNTLVVDEIISREILTVSPTSPPASGSSFLISP